MSLERPAVRAGCARSDPKELSTLHGRIILYRPYFYCRACGKGWHPLNAQLELAGGTHQFDIQERSTRLGAEIPFGLSEGQFPLCEEDCCELNEHCSNGHCCPTGQRWCGGRCCNSARCCGSGGTSLCCSSTESCTSEHCCPTGQQWWGGECCPPTQRCGAAGASEDCCNPTTEECSSGHCCPNGTQWCGGQCCPTSRVCGTGAACACCLASVQACVNGACVTPPPPQPCNTTISSGGPAGETRTIALGRTSGTFTVSFETRWYPDRIIVTYEGLEILRSPCFKTWTIHPVTQVVTADIGPQLFDVSYAGSSTQITVTVEPNCDAGFNNTTWWQYKVSCPN